MKYKSKIIEYISKLTQSDSKSFGRGKGLASIAIMLVLSSCGVPPGAPECVNEYEWGNIESREVIVHANQEFTYSGIRVKSGEELDIQISGVVDLCSGDRVIKSDTYDLRNENGFAITRIYGINPRNPNWQEARFIDLDNSGNPTGTDINMRVNRDDKLSILVNGSYKDRSAVQREGRGLYVYFGDDSPPNDAWWYGATNDNSNNPDVCDPTFPGCRFVVLRGSDNAGADPKQRDMCDPNAADTDLLNTCILAPELSDNREGTSTSNYPQFFELFDNGTVGDNAGGYQGNAPQDGNIWFRYARTADARGLDNSGGEQFSPWRGRYAWDNHGKCTSCGLPVIAAACIPTAWLGLYQVCVTTWVAACAASGRLQEVSGIETGAGRKCREHYGGDHWVDDAYDGTQATNYSATDGDRNPNSEEGYDIHIGQGCIGTYGEYMNMVLGTGNPSLQNQTTPEGCNVADPGCEEVIDGWSGLPVQYVKYSATGTRFSLDMRPEAQPDPAVLPYKGPGHYYDDSIGIAGTPELWFEIREDGSTASPLAPDPAPGSSGFFGDNFGAYKVKIRTTKVDSDFSDFTQKIIDPIKGLIFGYCRVNAVNDGFGNTTYLKDSQLDYTIDEAGCTGSYVDFYGNAQEYRDYRGETTGRVIEAWQPGIAERMYYVLVGGTISYDGATRSPFLDTLRVVLVLYIMLYGFLFMLGMVNDDYGDFIKRIIKLSIVSVLFSPDSWDFFNGYLFSVFTEGIDTLIFYMSGDFTGNPANDALYQSFDQANDPGLSSPPTVPSNFNVFSFTDITIDTLFTKATWIKIAGLLLASPIGWLYILLILLGMYFFILAIFKAMILYLLANLALALLMIVAPIFLTFMLFDRTRPLFKGWIQNLINYTLQPVMVITALAVFNIFVYSAIYSLLYYRVCWDTKWHLTINLPPFINDKKWPLVNFYLPSKEGAGVSASTLGLDTSIQFFMILIYLILLTSLYNFVKWMADLASELALGSPIGSLANAADQTLNKFAGYAKGVATFGTSAAVGAAKGFASGKTAGGKVGRGALGAINRSIVKPLGKKLTGK